MGEPTQAPAAFTIEIETRVDRNTRRVVTVTMPADDYPHRARIVTVGTSDDVVEAFEHSDGRRAPAHREREHPLMMISYVEGQPLTRTEWEKLKRAGDAAWNAWAEKYGRV